MACHETVIQAAYTGAIEGAGPRGSGGAAGTKGEQMHLLVVEDDLDLARVLLAMFQRHEVETVHARTGREAIQLCARLSPGLVLHSG